MTFSKRCGLVITIILGSLSVQAVYGAWPVVDSSGYQIECVNSTYGVRTYDGGTFHDGVDICMDNNTDRVKAVAGGTVRRSYAPSGDIGWFIAIEDSYGGWHYYWHMLYLQGTTPAAGAVVNAGAVLGGRWTGNLGNHCHYSHFTSHIGTAPMLRATRQAMCEHPFREIGSVFDETLDDGLWWEGVPLLCHWMIYDYEYGFNGFRLVDYDAYQDMVLYDSDFPYKNNCCWDPDGNYVVGNNIQLIPTEFDEGAQPYEYQPKIYEVQFDCVWNHQYQMCISKQPDYAYYVACDPPVANEPEPEVRVFIEDGRVAIVGNTDCATTTLINAEWSDDPNHPKSELSMSGEGLCAPGFRSQAIGQYPRNYITLWLENARGDRYSQQFTVLMQEIGQQALSVSPNPFTDATEVRMELGAGYVGGIREVEIYDIRGRAIRRMANGVQKGFAVSWAWDGKDENGGTVAAGVYLAIVKGETTVKTARIMKIR